MATSLVPKIGAVGTLAQLSTDVNGNVTGLVGPDGFKNKLMSSTDVDLVSKANTSKDLGTRPTKLIAFGADWATGGAINSGTRAVVSAPWGIESNALSFTPSAATGYLARLVGNGLAAALDWSAVESLALLVYSAEPLPSNAFVKMYVGNDTTWTNVKTYTFNINTQAARGGFHVLKIRVDQTDALYGPYPGVDPNPSIGWQSQGTGATVNSANVQFVRFDFSNFSGQTVILEGLYANGKSRPCVTMTFDNWYLLDPSYSVFASHSRHIAPIFKRNGWNFGMPPVVDTADVNWRPDEYRRMHKAGNDIIGGDVTGVGFITSGRTDAEIFRDIGLTTAALHAEGLLRGSDLWILNESQIRPAIRAHMKDAGYKWIRGGTTERIFTPLEYGREDVLVGSISCDGKKSSEMQAIVSRAIAYGDSVHLFWHQFRTGGAAESAKPEQIYTSWVEAFADFCAWLRAEEVAGNVDVLSPTQWVQRASLYDGGGLLGLVGEPVVY